MLCCVVLLKTASLPRCTCVVLPSDKLLLGRRKGLGDSFLFLYLLLISNDDLK